MCFVELGDLEELLDGRNDASQDVDEADAHRVVTPVQFWDAVLGEVGGPRQRAHNDDRNRKVGIDQRESLVTACVKPAIAHRFVRPVDENAFMPGCPNARIFVELDIFFTPTIYNVNK